MGRTVERSSFTSATIDLLFVLVSVLLSYHFLHWRLAGDKVYDLATPDMLVAGAAYLPFQYRALVPWLVRALAQLPWPQSVSTLNLFLIVEFISIVLLCAAFRRYLSFFIENKPLNSLLALSLFYVLPFHFIGSFWYPWDMPSLLFFTLGLISLYEQKWQWYYPLFVVATFNRETTYFLSLLYLLTAIGKTSWRTIALHTSAQLLLWVVIKLLLYYLYLDNPRLGYGLFELQLGENLNWLREPAVILGLLSLWGFLWLPLILWRHLVQSEFVKRTVLLLPPFFGIMLVVGVIDELRIYGELIPIVLSAFLLILKGLFRTAEADPAGPG